MFTEVWLHPRLSMNNILPEKNMPRYSVLFRYCHHVSVLIWYSCEHSYASEDATTAACCHQYKTKKTREGFSIDVNVVVYFRRISLLQQNNGCRIHSRTKGYKDCLTFMISLQKIRVVRLVSDWGCNTALITVRQSLDYITKGKDCTDRYCHAILRFVRGDAWQPHGCLCCSGRGTTCQHLVMSFPLLWRTSCME